MAFKEIVTRRKFKKYSECAKGDVLVEGVYIGKKQNTKYNLDKHHFLFQLDDGSVQVLNYAGQLDWIIENNVELGDKVKIVYDGKIILEKGAMAGRESNQFKLFKDGEADKLDIPKIKEVQNAQSLNVDDLE